MGASFDYWAMGIVWLDPAEWADEASFDNWAMGIVVLDAETGAPPEGQPTMRRWEYVPHMPHTYSIGA